MYLHKMLLNTTLAKRLYINDLVEEIKASGIGVHYENDVIGILLYADDVVLLAESENDLQTLLDIS